MGSIGGIFTLIFIVIFVVRGIASLTGNDQDSKKQPGGRGRSLEEWNQLQTQRRGEQTQQSDALERMQAQASQVKRKTQIDASQMSMAERIELARQRARQQAGGGAGDDAAQALERAREKAQAQAQRKREVAMQRQNVEREQAQRQRAELERRRHAEARRRAEQHAKSAKAQKEQAQQGSRSGRKHQARPSQTIKRSKSSMVRDDSLKRVHKGHDHADASLKVTPRSKRTAVGIGKLNAASLRKAIILKELIDKPIALRNPQEDLLS